MSIKVEMPNGGDEKISPESIFAIREPLAHEKEESPSVQSCLWGSGYRIFPTETVPALIAKFKDIKFARLTAPDGTPLFVSAVQVEDRDERSAIIDHESTKSVLCFGPGPLAPRVRVRESHKDLVAIWTRLDVPTDALN